MAEMIPDSIPSTAPRGEKLLFNAFRDSLPDNFIVWHEPSARWCDKCLPRIGQNIPLFVTNTDTNLVRGSLNANGYEFLVF